MKPFKTPSDAVGDLSAETAATLIATAADVALALDERGVIHDSAFQQMDLLAELESYGKLIGRPWAEIVTPESQPKVEALLREAAARHPSRWRQVNHMTSRGEDIPILYAVVPLSGGRFVAFGRDLRSVAKLQQRLVEAQMAMERDYSRLRHVETRYRLLFERSPEAVVIVDDATRKIVEANPAALHMLGDGASRLVGRAFADLFEADDAQSAQALLSDIRSAGRGEARLHSAGHVALTVSGSLFRHEASTLVLLRLAREGAVAIEPPSASEKARLIDLVERAPDGYVVTDRRGAIITANAAFLEMAQLNSDAQPRGEALERWLGRPGIDMSVVLANLRQHGAVRLFATILRGEYGAVADVELSAAGLADDRSGLFGFSIRNVGRRIAAEPKGENELPRSAEQLTELIGRMPLKEIVRETADVIERLCIEAALEMTGDNRASAAEMLGLSRQSLYVKLRRYGLADASAEGEAQDEPVQS